MKSSQGSMQIDPLFSNQLPYNNTFSARKWKHSYVRKAYCAITKKLLPVLPRRLISCLIKQLNKQTNKNIVAVCIVYTFIYCIYPSFTNSLNHFTAIIEPSIRAAIHECYWQGNHSKTLKCNSGVIKNILPSLLF